MTITLGSLTVDPVANVVTCEGVALPLGAKVVATLAALCERSGKVVPKAELLERVWGATPVDDSSLWQNVHVLRGVLARHAPAARIETLKGRGYRLLEAEPEVAPLPEPAPMPVPAAAPRPRAPWLLPAAMFVAGAVAFAGVSHANAHPRPARIVLIRLQPGESLPALPPFPRLPDETGAAAPE